jgi:hypothetical protein
MTTGNYQSIKSLIINALKCDSYSTLKKTRKHFILNVLLCFLSIKGKINFLQLSRFSSFCEQFFRIHFENRFNFQGFNLSLISSVAFDPGCRKIPFPIKSLMSRMAVSCEHLQVFAHFDD